MERDRPGGWVVCATSNYQGGRGASDGEESTRKRYMEAMELLNCARKLNSDPAVNQEILELCCLCKYLSGNFFAARSYAATLRKDNGFNKTALYVLAEIHASQCARAVTDTALQRSRPDQWYKDLENVKSPRQVERVLQAIAEAYKSRKRFDDAYTWTQKGLQQFPSSTKLQCFKMQLELDKKTWNNLLDL